MVPLSKAWVMTTSIAWLAMAWNSPAEAQEWIEVDTAEAPPPRGFHVMAYDRIRDVAMLFGGIGEDQEVLGDTWVFKDDVWRSAESPAAPRARIWSAAAFDEERGVVVLFGGFGAGFLDDTWTWDGTTWTELAPATRPPARYGHALAFDRARQVLLLVGGYSTTGAVEDAWAWDGSQWALLDSGATRPDARYWHGAATTDDGVLVFAGLGSDNETWLWDGAAWAVSGGETSPPARHTYALAGDRIALLHGGNEGLGDTWEWDGAWREVTSTASPGSRAGSTLVGDGTGSFLLFGGGADGDAFGDLWRYHPSATDQPLGTPTGCGCGSQTTGLPIALAALALVAIRRKWRCAR